MVNSIRTVPAALEVLAAVEDMITPQAELMALMVPMAIWAAAAPVEAPRRENLENLLVNFMPVAATEPI